MTASRNTIRCRVNRLWRSMEDAVNWVNSKKKLSVSTYCREHWLNNNIVSRRLREWQSFEEAIKFEETALLCLPWEIRVDIKWYEWYYEISQFGRVRTYRKKKQWYYGLRSEPVRILKWWKKRQSTIYNCHTLYKDTDRKRHYKTARLVAQAFMWLDYNDSRKLVCHIDDDWMNNRLDNLFLSDYKWNTLDSIKKWRCRLTYIKSNPLFDSNNK
jgi:hypothetical protein